MDAPCLKCQKREDGCHANCGDYKQWREEKDAVNKKRHDAWKRNNVYYDYDTQTTKRLSRYHNGNRHK